MATDLEPVPPWVKNALNAYWDRISAAAPRHRKQPVMPVPIRTSKQGVRSFGQLGCGHYGCVMHSTKPGVVVKVTSDESEAAFITASKKLSHEPYGMVRYFKIREVPTQHRGRRVFVIWREEVYDVGFVGRQRPRGENPYEARSLREFEANLNSFKTHAAGVRDYMRKSKDPASSLRKLKENEDRAWEYSRAASMSYLTGALKAAVSLQHCKDIAETMEHTYRSDSVGEALGAYLEDGMLLADVHHNNVAIAKRRANDYYDSPHEITVISDPGHMVPLDPKWLQVRIKEV